jgi:hypothetical protein
VRPSAMPATSAANIAMINRRIRVPIARDAR